MTIDLLHCELSASNSFVRAAGAPRMEDPPDHFDRRAIQNSQTIKTGDYQTRQVTALRRALAWFLKRHADGTLSQIHVDNWNLGSLEMDNAPTSMLKFRVDDFGNCLIQFGSKEMGS